MKCGCAPHFLTSVSVPITAEEAVARACPCCGAEAGRRCVGGAAGWLPCHDRERAYVDVCPDRLEQQIALELVA